MIYIGLGSNLPSAAGSPSNTVKAALSRLPQSGIQVRKVSPWYESAPVPASDQPWFVNGVAEVETELAPQALLAELLAIEQEFGRERGQANAARSLDLDLLDHHGAVLDGDPVLPHPRLHQRAFVLYPLADVAPNWIHPVSGLNIQVLLEDFSLGSGIRRLAPASA